MKLRFQAQQGSPVRKCEVADGREEKMENRKKDKQEQRSVNGISSLRDQAGRFDAKILG